MGDVCTSDSRSDMISGIVEDVSWSVGGPATSFDDAVESLSSMFSSLNKASLAKDVSESAWVDAGAFGTGEAGTGRACSATPSNSFTMPPFVSAVKSAVVSGDDTDDDTDEVDIFSGKSG